MSAPGSAAWGEVLGAAARAHPHWEAADLYKLLHQATQGAGHAAPDHAAARRRLEQELQEMGSGPEEPLAEPIRPDGALVRVHLRPWQAAGLDTEVLLEAFLGTAGSWTGSLPELEEALQWAALHAGRLGVDRDALADITRRCREQGYPAVHHSAAYTHHYRPAYRVAAARLLPPGPAILRPGAPG